MTFGESLKRLRTEKGLSQKQLAEMMFVDRTSITRWESDSRVPDALMLSRLSACLGIAVDALLSAGESAEKPNVILVDDETIFLAGGMPVLEELLPQASITGFTRPSEVLTFAKETRIDLAFLDVEMGKTSGFDLCQELLAIYPRTNVIFLTAYADYSLNAWNTGASGFLLKPLTEKSVKEQLSFLRYPIGGLTVYDGLH